MFDSLTRGMIECRLETNKRNLKTLLDNFYELQEWLSGSWLIGLYVIHDATLINMSYTREIRFLNDKVLADKELLREDFYEHNNVRIRDIGEWRHEAWNRWSGYS